MNTYRVWIYNNALKPRNYELLPTIEADTPEQALEIAAKRLRKFCDIFIVDNRYGDKFTDLRNDPNVLVTGKGAA
jgi:hypothetical protein